jgi:hypothetical protein
MPGIPREVAEHSLDILPQSRAVQQRLRRFDEERRRAIGAELRKLLEAGFIKEVFHPTWLANPVLVKKKMGSGGCVWTILILIRHVLQFLFLCRVSIRSLIRPLGANYSVFLMPIPGTTRSR